MILGKKALEHLFSDKWTGATNIGPNSVDVTLSDQFLLWENGGKPIDPYVEQDLFTKHQRQKILLPPGQMILGSLNEAIDCSAPFGEKYFAPMYEGRSTMGRLGIATHITAGFGDYGFSGCFTLEIVNHSPNHIWLHAGMRIGQVYFVEVHCPEKYTGVYDGQTGPMAPRLGRERF